MSHRSPSTPDPGAAFLRRLPLTLMLGMVLWLVLRPALDTATTSLAQLLVRSFEVPRVTQLVVEDHRAQVRRSDFRFDSAIPTISLTEAHFNTIVLLALAAALPRPLSRLRLERLLMAWTVLLATQSLSVVLHVKCLYAMSLGVYSETHYSDLARNVYGFLRHFSDLPGRFSFPFVVWLGFNWEVVTGLVGVRSQPTTSQSRRSAGGRQRTG